LINSKGNFFGTFSALFPASYFEKAPIVRIVWELWAAIRFSKGDIGAM
jgi:hypothetical protein